MLCSWAVVTASWAGGWKGGCRALERLLQGLAGLPFALTSGLLKLGFLQLGTLTVRTDTTVKKRRRTCARVCPLLLMAYHLNSASQSETSSKCSYRRAEQTRLICQLACSTRKHIPGCPTCSQLENAQNFCDHEELHNWLAALMWLDKPCWLIHFSTS